MPKLIKKYQNPSTGIIPTLDFQKLLAGSFGKGISPTAKASSIVMDIGKAVLPQAELTSSADDLLSSAGDLAMMINPAAGMAFKALDFANRSFGKTTARQQTSGLTLNTYGKQTSEDAGKKGTLISTWFGKNKRINKKTAEADRFNANAGAIESASMRQMQAAQTAAPDVMSRNNSQLYSGLAGNYGNKILTASQGAQLTQIRQLLSKRKVEEEPKSDNPSIIPDGALHARKHSLPKEIASEVTNKGIPVITYEDGDKIVQHAEIEVNEIIFSKSATEKLEEYFKRYKDNPSDELAIACGKFLAEEILENTEDNTGLIDTIE